MTSDQALRELADICGVFPEFVDLGGVTRPTSQDTQRALIGANGLAIETEAEIRETLADLRAQAQTRLVPHDIVVTSDQITHVACARPVIWEIVLEGHEDVFAGGRGDAAIDLPALPSGVHELHLRAGRLAQRATLIAAPSRAPSLNDVSGTGRTWGMVAALYGLRSERNTGLGDFEDLAQLGEALGAQGAGFLGINPVHALGWADVDTISPYSPTHRGFLNTNHISLDLVPHARSFQAAPDRDDAFIDYASFGRAHRSALRTAYAAFVAKAPHDLRLELADFTQAGGVALRDFAMFETLSETRGGDWRTWPRSLRTPENLRAQGDDPDGAFHIWLQWLASRQLEAAQRRSKASGMALGLYLDLAVGARLDGAEAWGAGDTLAQGISLGAPPDQLSPAGQNWQLAAYAPRKLTSQKYEPLRHVLRGAMQHCGVLRIDHALGLNRSYWIPENGAPGGYIRQPFQSLMALIAIEAQRAKTVIVGEDLGLVPEGFRDTMEAKGLYGYTVVQYEKTDVGAFRQARDLRPQSLACFGTHDTPTLTGFWEGCDIDWWHKLGWIDAAEQHNAKVRRQDEKSDLLDQPVQDLKTLSSTDLADRVHQALATGPTALVAVQLDDVIGVREAQNLPGTIDEHPNWRRKTPLSVSGIAQHSGLRDTAKTMAQAGRSTPTRGT